jgi:hypothetical protein
MAHRDRTVREIRPEPIKSFEVRFELPREALRSCSCSIPIGLSAARLPERLLRSPPRYREHWRAPREVLPVSGGAPRQWDYGGSRYSVLPRLYASAAASPLGRPEPRPIFVGGSPRAKDAVPRAARPDANGLSDRACPARPGDAQDGNYREGLGGSGA